MKNYKSNRIRLNHYYRSLQLILLWSPMLLALVVPSAITRNGSMLTDPSRNSSNNHEMKRKRQINLNGGSRLAFSKSECTMMGMGFKSLAAWNFQTLPHDLTRQQQQQQQRGKYSNGSILRSKSDDCIGNTVTNRFLGDFDLQMIPSSSTFEEDYHHFHSSSFQTNTSKSSIFKKRLETIVGRDRSTTSSTSSTSITSTAANPPMALQVLQEKDDTRQLKRDDNALTVIHTMDTNFNRNNKNNHPSCVPLWFPYIPTRSQIESLNVMELKDACQERGLSKVSRFETGVKKMSIFIYIYICI